MCFKERLVAQDQQSETTNNYMEVFEFINPLVLNLFSRSRKMGQWEQMG